MRRLVVPLSACVLALSMIAGASPAKAAVPGYDSSFFGESAFLNLAFGQSGQFAAIFTNTGTTSWQRNTVSQVNLGICLADKVTCSVASPNASWNDGSWLSNIAYATSSTDLVAPGQNAFFTYNVRAPSTGNTGTYRFNGELVQASTLQVLRGQGYYQDATLNVTTDVNPPNAVVFTSGYPAQSGMTVVTKGTAYDVGGGVATVSVKVQRQDAGVWGDATAYASATADDGLFSSSIELFTQTTGTLTIPAGVPVQVLVRVTDFGGNANVFSSPLAFNGGLWSSSPQSGVGSDTTPPSLIATSCIDPLTGAALSSCGVFANATTPSGQQTVIFTAFAQDNVGVAGAEFAVSRPGSGDTVIGWTPCAPADGAFGSLQETLACTVTFPGTTAPGGTSYAILVRAIDAAGNKSTPVDPSTGVFGGSEFCTFFQSTYASGSGGASTTANCVWTVDNIVPFLSAAQRGVGTITPAQPVDQNSLIVLGFSEAMRAISTTNPQSITVFDGLRTLTLTSGVNANFARCFSGFTVATPGNCLSTNDGSAGHGIVWQIVPTGPTGLFYPLTITGATNFRDYAGNALTLSFGDKTID